VSDDTERKCDVCEEQEPKCTKGQCDCSCHEDDGRTGEGPDDAAYDAEMFERTIAARVPLLEAVAQAAREGMNTGNWKPIYEALAALDEETE
jgi:hypothetical protein